MKVWLYSIHSRKNRVGVGGVMKTRTVLLILMVGAAAIACTSNQKGEALQDARQVCTALGFDSQESEGSSANEEPMTSIETSKYADDLDDEVNQAARAARLDQRWDRLSNAVTDGQEWFRQMAIARDQSLYADEVDIAQERADEMDIDEIVNVMRQECRKALAQ